MQLILEAKRLFYLIDSATRWLYLPINLSAQEKFVNFQPVVNSLASYLVNLFTHQVVISLTRKLFHSFTKKGLVKQASYVTS